MWGKWTFLQIVPPERLVYVVSFSDEQGGTTRHPMSDTWPLEMLSTMTLSDEGGKTTITMTVEPHNATDEEAATFDAGREGMTAGFAGTMDQLAAHLASTS